MLKLKMAKLQMRENNFILDFHKFLLKQVVRSALPEFYVVDPRSLVEASRRLPVRMQRNFG